MTVTSLISALISLHCLRVAEHISLKLAVMTYWSIDSTSPSFLQTCFTSVADQTTRGRRPQPSSGSPTHSSLYSRQAGVSGFGCHRLERPASPRRICAVTRGFQTTTWDLSAFSFLPNMTHVLLLHSSLLSGHMWSLQLLTIFRQRCKCS